MQIAASPYFAAVKPRVPASSLTDAHLVDEVVTVFRANRRVYGEVLA